MNPPPTSIEIAILMDYLSEKKCAELCKMIDIGTLSWFTKHQTLFIDQAQHTD